MNTEELLEELDAMLDSAPSVPLSGGKVMLNADAIRKIIDDIRLYLPQEIRQARAIVAERNDLISEARKEADSITRKAEEKARNAVANEEIVRRATISATETTAQAQARARDIRKAATEFAENIMRTTEDVMSQKLAELRQARQNIRTSMRNDAAALPDSRPQNRSDYDDEDEEN